MSQPALRAYRVFLLLGFIGSLLLAMVSTIEIVYQVEAAKLSAFQVVLVGSVLEGTTFLCEIPTGIVADVYSRRLSVIIGYTLIGLGFLVEGLFPHLIPILLAQVIWGIGYTFISGAEEAWIASEVGSENIGPIYMRGSQVAQLGTILGMVISVSLASFQLSLPLILSGGAFILFSGTLRVIMPEHAFKPAAREERNSWRVMAGTIHRSWNYVRTSSLLLILLTITAFYGMANEGFARLWTVEFLSSFTFPSLGHLEPVIWFGIFQIGTMILTIIGTEIVKRRLNMKNHQLVARTQFVLNLFVILSVVFFGFAPNFVLALIAFWSTSTLVRIGLPIYQTWLISHTDPEIGATILSSSSQSDALGRIVGGPIIGAIGSLISIRIAMAAIGLVLSPVLFLFASAERKSKASSVESSQALSPTEP
ncbi:MAG TPA: MFS transporter [Ktedonobacteraceae bacterium]|nr:MFS transporter [Ktedonobacteraceae bacterium]